MALRSWILTVVFVQRIRIVFKAFNLRFQAATGQLERPARVREVRRTIARIKTLQTQRSAAGAAN
jgi:hypothetical protein